MRKRIAVLWIAVWIVCPPLGSWASSEVTCLFPPGWETRQTEIKAIVEALTQNSGITVKPLVAKSNPQILEAFSSDKPCLVYAGSFVQAIIRARSLGTPLVQVADGKELYSGIMIYPQGADPAAVLKDHPDQIAFAAGASSGESAAKAATQGKASMALANHNAAAGAVAAGKAKAAFVKNWWWEGNKVKFPALAAYEVPGVSEAQNPDNILSASRAVSAEQAKKIADAALASKEAFGAQKLLPVGQNGLDFSLGLMKKGHIDPLAYSW